MPFTLEVNGRVFAQAELSSQPVRSDATSASYFVSIREWEIDLEFAFHLEGKELVFTIPHVREGGKVRLERLRLIDHRLVSGLAANGDSFLRHIARRNNWARPWVPGTGTYNQWEDWGTVTGAPAEPGAQPAYHATVWNEKICAGLWCSIHIEPYIVELSAQGQVLADRSGRFSVSAGTWHYRLRGTLAEPFELRLALLADANGDGTIDWAEAATWEANRTFRPNPLYREAVIYKLYLDDPSLPCPHYTYADCLDVIKRLHWISGGLKQIVYLVGWQHSGHDTGYPSHNEFNPRPGSQEELVQLMNQARDWNATVSLHGNFDDSFRIFPEFNPELLSRDPAGEKVWFYNHMLQAPTYSINHTLAQESGYNAGRIKRLLENLPLRESIHLDAHRPYNEVWFEDGTHISAECEIQRGMIPLRRELLRHGLDLTTEDSDAEKRGIYHWVWIQPNYLHPYATLMAHGRVPGLWRAGTARDQGRTRIEGHALGLSISQLEKPVQSEADVTASFYLDWMYAEILRRKPMLSYRVGHWDNGVEATYADQTRVTAGVGGAPLQAWYEGIPMARGEDRFLPWRGDVFFLFSLQGGEQEWTLPDSWAGRGLRLNFVHERGDKEVPFLHRAEQKIRVNVPAGIPLRLQAI